MPACASKMDIVPRAFFEAKGAGANVSQKKACIIKWGPLFVIVSVCFVLRSHASLAGLKLAKYLTMILNF